MKTFPVFIITIGLIYYSTIAYGQTICKNSANIYFINGVNKPSERDVQDSSLYLNENIIKFSKYATDIKKVTYLYNDSDGLFLDTFFELAAQKAMERKVDISELFINIGSAALDLPSTLSSDDMLIVRQANAAMLISKLPPKTQALISEFSQRVSTESLNAGVQAILVPHSQGNMFANEVYDNLKRNLPTQFFRGFGVMNVANPANRAPSGQYITVVQDLVINLLASIQSAITGALKPMVANFNASLSALTHNISGHGFTDVYLAQDLPSGTLPEDSLAANLVNKIDIVIRQSNSFWDTPNFILINGVMQPRPAWYPADSSVYTVCFPDPVGGF